MVPFVTLTSGPTPGLKSATVNTEKVDSAKPLRLLSFLMDHKIRGIMFDVIATCSPLVMTANSAMKRKIGYQMPILVTLESDSDWATVEILPLRDSSRLISCVLLRIESDFEHVIDHSTEWSKGKSGWEKSRETELNCQLNVL